MNIRLAGWGRLCSGIFVLACVWGNVAQAQPLDDVGLEHQGDGIVATIRMTGPVQYLRHFPESHGKTLEIYYDRVQGAASSETWLDNEVRKSPPSSLIPSFTVTTRDQQSKPKLVIEFSREAEYSVAPGKDNRSLLITIVPERRPVSTGPLPFLPTIKPAPAPVPAGTLSEEAAALADINQQARALMIDGRDALQAKKNEAAVDALNKLLLLPPNDYTQDAQEWVGVARERATQDDKARIEYELYLRLYPEGDGAARVAQRLAGLGKEAETVVEKTEKKEATRWMTFGSISSRYYFGKSNIDQNYTYNNAMTTSSFSLTDQSMLITSEDASARYISGDYDSRIVFRNVNTKNFLASQPSLNRMNAAYGEIKNRRLDYQVRMGRQSATGGGVLGRFDGVFGSYGDPQVLRVNAVTGSLVDYSGGSRPKFAGASIDWRAFSLYGINQKVDGFVDRRAFGTEWRYFEGKDTAYALLDYDAIFKAVNAAQFMGTTGVSNMTVNYMVDHRKAPSLSLRNAQIGADTSSVNALLRQRSLESLRDLALQRTATSNMGLLGVTVPFKEKWQIGGDIRLSNVSGLPPSGTAGTPEGLFPGLPSAGTQKSVTGQVTGSSLYRSGDIWSGSVTLSSGTAKGNTMYVYNHTQLNGGWMIDTSLQLSSYTDQLGGTTKRTSPMVRGSYRFIERLTFDVDCGYEMIKSSGTQQTTDTSRFSYSAGLRWDF